MSIAWYRPVGYLPTERAGSSHTTISFFLSMANY